MILTTEQMVDIFCDKLAKTQSFSEAFTKVVWVAYTAGTKAQGNIACDTAELEVQFEKEH